MASIAEKPSPSKPASRWRAPETVALLFLLAAFAGIRLWNLTSFALDSDEIFSLLASRSLESMFHGLRADVVHPPLSYLLLWLWMKIGGESLVWLRLLPYLTSMAALIPLWIIFDQMRLEKPVRILALGLLTISDYQVFHARYVRMYALLFLLSLISMALFNALLERGTRRRAVALTAVNLLLVYTQYFGWMVIAVEGLHLLCFDRRKLKAFLTGTAAIAALFLPWAVIAAQGAIAKGGLTSNLGWIRHPKIGDLWWYYVGCNGPLWPVPVASAIVFLLFGAIAAGLWRVYRKTEDELQRRRLYFAILLAAIPPAATYLLSNRLRNSIWGNRHLIVSTVPYLIVLALALVALRPKWVRAIFLTMVVTWGMWGAYRVTCVPELRNNLDVLTGQLVALNAREGYDSGDVTVCFLDPYLSFPMRFYLETHYHRKWKLVDVPAGSAVAEERVWVVYNDKTWKQAQQAQRPQDLLRAQGYEIGPGVWSGDRWDRVGVFLAVRRK